MKQGSQTVILVTQNQGLEGRAKIPENAILYLI